MSYLVTYDRNSNIIRVRLMDGSSTTGAGLTGLTSASTGLNISTIADTEATATTYTVTGATIETISTLGTYAAPTATKCRFKEVDATNLPGLYEIQLADARFSVANSTDLIVSIQGATNLVPTMLHVPLQRFDLQTATQAVTATVSDKTGFDLVDAPNAKAVTAIQAGLMTTGGYTAPDNTSIGTILTSTNKLETMLQAGTAPATYQFTEDALEQAPGVDASTIWGYATRTLSTSPPTVAEIDTQLSTTHGAGTWATLGSGTKSWTYTVTASGTGLPLDGVSVRVSTDIGGSNIVASGLTNASGVVTFYLDVGTYYVWCNLTGYNFSNPDTEVVS